jgi:Flp pilus assembly pilin Flp
MTRNAHFYGFSGRGMRGASAKSKRQEKPGFRKFRLSSQRTQEAGTSMRERALGFLGASDGATAIEYALIGAGVALAISVAVGSLGTHLSASFGAIANAFP